MLKSIKKERGCCHRDASPVFPMWTGLCSPSMAAIRASGALTPLPGETGLRGLRGLSDGEVSVSGETKRSFLALAKRRGEELCAWPSRGRGQRLRDCREGKGEAERAGTAGLRLRFWWCRLPPWFPGLGLREVGAKRTSVLSSSELTSELSERERHTGPVGVDMGSCTCRRSKSLERGQVTNLPKTKKSKFYSILLNENYLRKY